VKGPQPTVRSAIAGWRFGGDDDDAVVRGVGGVGGVTQEVTAECVQCGRKDE
jgi:hypothetical protein